MNAKNYDLFFNDDTEETAYITLSEDDYSFDLEVIATAEIEEFEKEYVAALPVEQNPEFEEGQILILCYSEDADGDPVFTPIEDEEEAEQVCSVFEQLLSEDDDEDDDDENEIEIDEDDYLNDISDLFPGVSIKKD